MNEEVTNNEVTNNDELNNVVPELTPQQIKKQMRIFRQIMRGNRGKHSRQRQNNGKSKKSKRK